MIIIDLNLPANAYTQSVTSNQSIKERIYFFETCHITVLRLGEGKILILYFKWCVPRLAHCVLLYPLRASCLSQSHSELGLL